jgi:mannan endo-1,4-beta-mannosidase
MASEYPHLIQNTSRIHMDSRDLKFVGTNAYWLPYLNSEDDISNTLANMSKAGITVVRTWAFNGANDTSFFFFFCTPFSFLAPGRIDVTTIPEKGSWLQLIKDGTTQFNTGANGIQRLDKVVELAKKYNIYVYFTLTNNWFPASSDFPPPPVAPSPLPRNFLSNDYG